MISTQSRFRPLLVNPGMTQKNRDRALQSWYRQQLKARIPTLLEHWQPIVGQSVSAWGIKKMKTKWGTCNIQQRRIWLNLELAKKPPECLEYVVIHELVHLLERHHNDRFKALMDEFLPPLAHPPRSAPAQPLRARHLGVLDIKLTKL